MCGIYKLETKNMKSIFTLIIVFTFNFLQAQMIDAEVVAPTCFGDENGSINITFTAGTPPYQYQWSNGANTEDINSLNSGFYSLTITDSQDQNFFGEWDILDVDPIEVELFYEDVLCHQENGPDQGFIEVQAFGGTNDFTYLWSGPGVEGFTEPFFTELQTGAYTVTATDSNGCSDFAEVEVFVPEELIVDAIITNVDCVQNQTELGSIQLTIQGGFPPYDVFWIGDVSDPTSQDQFDLSIGEYSAMITDANGCLVDQVFIIAGPETMEISAITTDVGCENGNILFGSIDLNVTGGTPPYNYNWSGENVDPNASGQGDLLSGTYWVTVTDNEFCQSAELEMIVNTESIDAPNLCLITNDNPDGYNTVYWEDPIDAAGVEHFNIYREGTSAGQFDIIGTVDFSLDNEFFDTDANSTQQAYRYYVTAANACGHESAPSAIHKTIHLTINQGSFGNMNLIWDEYDGITYDQVVIYRGATPSTLEEYVSLPGNVFSYTDSDALAGDAYYQIVITTTVNCNTSVEEAQKLIFELKSNVAGFIVNNIQDIDWVTEIYPNPFEDRLHLRLDRSAEIEVFDYQGNNIYSERLTEGLNSISTIDFPQGIYIVRLSTNGESAVWRAMKSK